MGRRRSPAWGSSASLGLSVVAFVFVNLCAPVSAGSPEMVPAPYRAEERAKPNSRASSDQGSTDASKEAKPTLMTGEAEKSNPQRLPSASETTTGSLPDKSKAPISKTAVEKAAGGPAASEKAEQAKKTVKVAPTPAVTFAPIAFADLPGWAEDDHLAALKAFLQSCPPLIAAQKAGNKPGRIPTPPELLVVCDAAMQLPAKITRNEARAFFEQGFEPHRVIHAAPHGLLTGYYEPLIEGSRKREGRFQHPILSRPSDLVNVVDETQRGAVGVNFTHARMGPAGKLVPYATRAEIDAGALKNLNLELFYLADGVDVFFLQIQGSGQIKLPDGTVARVNYDGKNGHPYSSVGRYLIDNNLLSADKMSMSSLGKWLRADPERGKLAMQQNASYVFFRELPGDSTGPLGVLQIPLTTGRSLAVDPSVHTLGSPIYINAPTLTHALRGAPYQRLMIAQDVGSAIKGPERGDIYFGSGDAAGRIAGITKHPGHLFVLRPRTGPAQATTIATGSTKAAGSGGTDRGAAEKGAAGKGGEKPSKP